MNLKNKFNRYYWLRKIYTSKLFQLFQIKNPKLKKKIFTSIYKSNHWVQNGDSLPQEFVSISGHGSNIGTDQYKQLVNNFTNIIEKYQINSILDMPCGDFLWIKELVKNKDIKYLGIDIVEELIKNNNFKFKNEKINFQSFDIVNFNTNKEFDLVLIRDLFLHIKNFDIIKIINNLKSMNIKYVALNSYNNKKNLDVTIGQHRKVNLLIEPFNLEKPIYSFKDYEDDKFFHIYDLETLKK